MSKDKKYAKISFNAQVKPIKPVNTEFSLCKVYVQGIGCNRNGTYMSKDNVNKYLNTLNYCPVVGHLIEATNKETGEKHLYMGGHDWEITDDWEIRDLTVPYGVVVADSFGFETVSEYGEDVEYLTAQVILWTGRYSELYDAIYAEDFWFNQSMEINISQYRPYKEDSNYTELLEWNYSALCLLGKADENSTTGHTDKSEHTEPCFISSCVIPVEFSKSEFSELMSEMKEKLSFCFNNQSSTTEVDIEENKNGGKSMAEEVKDEVVEEITELVVEEETVEEEKDTVEETTEEVVEETHTDETEEVTDETTEEETVVDESNEDFSAMYAELKTQYETLEKEFSDYKAEHSFLDSDVTALKEYKANKETEERKCAEDALFAKYESAIGETDEFAKLRETASEYELDALEKECLCVVGKYAITNKSEVKETKKTDSLKFSIEHKEDEEDPCVATMKRYLGR